MNKRLLATLLALVALACLVGCEKTYTPDAEVEQYLNTGLTAAKSYAAVATVTYSVTELRATLDGKSTGAFVNEVSIDKTDENSLKMTISQQFSGEYVQNGVCNRVVELYRDQSGYVRKTTTNKEQKEALSETVAKDYVTSFFFVDNGVYKEGGLYYGDFFLLNIYKYPAEFFRVEGEYCGFKCERNYNDSQIGAVKMNQYTLINKLGLLVSNTETYVSQEHNLVLSSVLTATYTYID